MDELTKVKMQNVFEAGKVAYKAAPPLKNPTLTEKVQQVISVIVDVFYIVMLSIPHWLVSLYYFIFGSPRKVINGQVAVISGGANGIGKSIAFRLAQEGCKIAIVDIEHDAAVRTANELNLLNATARAYGFDVTDYKGLPELRSKIERDLGSVDILVNNAGLMPLLSLREGTEPEIQRIVDVNITSMFYMTRTFLSGMMARRRGHIINISSMSAFHPIPGAVIYSATKFAVQGFTEALAEELRQEGYGDQIHFTSVHPYFVSTRKDLMEAVSLRFPAITVEETAEEAVQGILTNKLIVSIPKMDRFLAAFVRILPQRTQQLIRDHILREKDSRMFGGSRSTCNEAKSNATDEVLKKFTDY